MCSTGTNGRWSVRSVPDPQSKVQITNDTKEFLAGRSSLAVRVLPSGNPIRLLYPSSRKAGIALAGKSHLVFWSKQLNGNIHAWKGLMPTVTLYESDEDSRCSDHSMTRRTIRGIARIAPTGGI